MNKKILKNLRSLLSLDSSNSFFSQFIIWWEEGVNREGRVNSGIKSSVLDDQMNKVMPLAKIGNTGCKTSFVGECNKFNWEYIRCDLLIEKPKCLYSEKN